ncbi:AP-1 complex subunit sigma-1 isoform X1 [Ananas comosus]|uniref:Adaptor AP-1 19 kDa protein n=3 Tax=Ananas comosus TaxID=4615 RepID=A0A6P5F6H0_ANACO|nr:AP-1 complex subunit sigma-1 isoform X1 [Ananas comosus]
MWKISSSSSRSQFRIRRSPPTATLGSLRCVEDIVFEKNCEQERRRKSVGRFGFYFPTMINFVLLISRQGKVRLTKWYSTYSQKERTKVIRELSGVILSRGPKLCNFVEWRGYKVVYRRYASLYFCMCIDPDDNELEILEIIHHFVEILDRYFGSVCELDLIFNFHKAYYILDEILLAGELQESSKKTVARLIAAQDSLVETAKEQASSISNIIAQATK